MEGGIEGDKHGEMEGKRETRFESGSEGQRKTVRDRGRE